MSIAYRVRAHPFEKEDFIYEVFETKNDADRFWEETLEGSDRIFKRLPYDTAVVTYEEFYHGTWVTLTTKTVIRDGDKE